MELDTNNPGFSSRLDSAEGPDDTGDFGSWREDDASRPRGVIFGLTMLLMGGLLSVWGGYSLIVGLWRGGSLAGSVVSGILLALGVVFLLSAGLAISGRIPWLTSFLERHAGDIRNMADGPGV